ncbi:MAG: hypothetical protein LBB94_11940 [Clostridiales bacterium]|jgi:uncharacterized protein|nr:hypothetical protein [Clostridiales bacterium]
MLIDEEWASFLAENNFLTGPSIDAGKDIHNSLRVGATGGGTHPRALKAALIKRFLVTRFPG